MTDIVSRRRREAEVRLAESVGAGGSLCAIGKSRQPYPAVKYHEGAAAALMEVERGADPHATLAKWREAALGRIAQQPDWAAYRAGGIDELTDLITELDHDPAGH